MKILFIHEVNWRQKPVFEIHDYPELLSLRGHDVSFIDFPEGEKLTGILKFKTFRTRLLPKQTRAHDESSVDLLTPGRICGVPLDRFLHSLTFVPLLVRTLRNLNFDVIVLYGVPTNGWQTVLVAKLFHIPVLFRAIDLSHEIRKTRFKLLIKLAEKFVYRSVNWISTNNQSLAAHCIGYGANENKVSIDYPGLDLDRFSPQEKDKDIQESLNICTGEKVVVFMGTLYRFAGISRFLELVATSLKRRPDIKVLILGDGEARSAIEKNIVQLGLSDQVNMLGFVDYNHLPKYLNLADVAINSFEVGVVTNSALPWKVVQYLACGVPTVATPLSGLVAYTDLNEENGVVFRNLDSTFIDTIIELLDDDIRRAKMGKKARDLVIARSSWPQCIERFESLLSELVVKK